jgi:hypothetical protein
MSMTDKDEALQYVTALGGSGVITRDELTSAFDAGVLGRCPAVVVPGQPGTTRAGIAEVLSYLGGAVVVTGVATLIGQNWAGLSQPTRLLATLGAGLAAFVVGVLLSRQPRTDRVAPAFYLISALVTPIGIAVLQDGAGMSPDSNSAQSVNALAMVAAFGATFYLLRRMVLLVVTVAFGIWLFVAVTGLFQNQGPWAAVNGGDGTPNYDAYRVMVVGLSLALLGYGLRSTDWRSLSGTLYGFGSLGLIVGALVLGGWPPHDSLIWNLAFPVLDFGILLAGVQVKSRSALTMGTLGLMAYIVKITAEYFTDSLGWPLALVLAGLGMIAIGYFSLMVRRRYLTSARTA